MEKNTNTFKENECCCGLKQSPCIVHTRACVRLCSKNTFRRLSLVIITVYNVYEITEKFKFAQNKFWTVNVTVDMAVKPGRNRDDRAGAESEGMVRC